VCIHLQRRVAIPPLDASPHVAEAGTGFSTQLVDSGKFRFLSSEKPSGCNEWMRSKRAFNARASISSAPPIEQKEKQHVWNIWHCFECGK
jgi:hypothetical protein